MLNLNFKIGDKVELLEDMRLDGLTLMAKGEIDEVVGVYGSKVALRRLVIANHQYSVDFWNLKKYEPVTNITPSNVIYIDFVRKVRI